MNNYIWNHYYLNSYILKLYTEKINGARNTDNINATVEAITDFIDNCYDANLITSAEYENLQQVNDAAYQRLMRRRTT